MDRATPFTGSWPPSPPTSSPGSSTPGRARWGPRPTAPTAAGRDFQLSQRAEFFEEEVGLETTLKRPIMNTRDEPHADATRYRRLHVIVGDANLADVATLLKVGTTSWSWPWWRTTSRAPAAGAGPPGPGHAQVSMDRTLRVPWRWPTAPRPPPWTSSGSCSAWPASTPRTGGWPAWSTRRWASRCSGGGRRSSTVWRPTRCRWPASSTGWPSCPCSRPTGSATAATGPTPAWPPSTSSTTTCGRPGRSSPGWTPSAW